MLNHWQREGAECRHCCRCSTVQPKYVLHRWCRLVYARALQYCFIVVFGAHLEETPVSINAMQYVCQVALHVAEKLLQLGAIPLTFSDSSGHIYEPEVSGL